MEFVFSPFPSDFIEELQLSRQSNEMFFLAQSLGAQQMEHDAMQDFPLCMTVSDNPSVFTLE